MSAARGLLTTAAFDRNGSVRLMRRNRAR